MKQLKAIRTLLFAAVVLAAIFSCPDAVFAGDGGIITLEQAASMALRHNQDLKLSENQVKISQISVRQNKDDYLPSLALDSSWSTTADRTDSTPDDVYQSLSSSLSTTFNLFKGFEDQASLEKSRRDLASDLNTRARTAQSVVHQAMTDYFQAYTDKESINVAKKNLEDNNLQLEEIQAFYKAGKRPVTDLYQQQAETSSAQLDLLNAQRDYKVSRLELMETIGMPAGADFDVSAPDSGTSMFSGDLDVESLVESAMNQRADILAQKESLLASRAHIKEASAGYWPELNLFGDVGSSWSGLRDEDLGEQFGDENLDARVGLSLSIPLFDRNITRNSVAQARISRSNEELALEKLKRRVEVEVGQAAADHQTAVKKVEVNQARLTYAAQALESTSQRYAAGASTLTELTQARANFVEAQYEKIQADVNLQVQALALAFYTGALDAKSFVDMEES